MKIISGKTGTPHVSAQEFRQFIEGTVGQESYILTSGENLEPELSTNNLLKIRSGIMSHHGNISCVELGTYDEVTIQNGTQGMKRIDLVVNRYSKNAETGIEKNEWVVIRGTPSESDPAVPAYTEGNLQEGDLVDDCPVFEVHLDGINVTAVKVLLPVFSNNAIVEIGQDGNNHYIKYKDGRLEQWGQTNVSYTDGFGRIDFPVPFAGNSVNDYVLFAQPRYVGGAYTVEILSVQKNGMGYGHVYSRQPSGNKTETHDVDWFARGYWK